MHREMESETKQESLVVMHANILLRNGIDQDIHKVGNIKAASAEEASARAEGIQGIGILRY